MNPDARRVRVPEAIVKKKAAIYVRVSTRYQVDKDSLPFQKEELVNYIKYALNIEDYVIFEDAGYSAKNTSRPKFQEMMTRIRNNEFTHLVVYKIDRISRNLLDFAQMYEELRKHRCSFVSKVEQFDTSTAMGEAMTRIVLVFAELERKMTGERVTAIMFSRAEKGLWNGAPIPIGYTWTDDFLLLLIGDGPAQDPVAVVLIVANGQVSALPTKAVVVGLVDQVSVQGLYDDFHDILLSNRSVIVFKGLLEPVEKVFTRLHLIQGQAHSVQRFAQVPGVPVLMVRQFLSEHIQDIPLAGGVAADGLQLFLRVPVQHLLQARGIALTVEHPCDPVVDKPRVRGLQAQALHPLIKLRFVIGEEAGESVGLFLVPLLQFRVCVHPVTSI